MEKRCTKCRQVKSIEDFPFYQKKAGTRRCECKSCTYNKQNIKRGHVKQSEVWSNIDRLGEAKWLWISSPLNTPF